MLKSVLKKCESETWLLIWIKRVLQYLCLPNNSASYNNSTYQTLFVFSEDKTFSNLFVKGFFELTPFL